MAAYAAKADLVARYGSDAVGIAFGTGTTGDDVIAKLTADATDKINAYVGARYSLPFAVVPALLVGLCCDIARYLASDDAAVLSDEIRQRYDDALAFLKDVSRGVATLGTEDVSAPTTANERISITSSRRLFTRTSMRGL